MTTDTNDWCAEPQWAAATEYRVEFSLSCGWVIVNPQGVESMLGHARKDDAEREAAALNAANRTPGEGAVEPTTAPATGQAGAGALSGTPSDSLRASESSPYAPGGAKFGKVCVHDKLERSCDECRDAIDLAANAATIKALQDRVRELEGALTMLHKTSKEAAARLLLALDRMTLADVTDKPWLSAAITHSVQDLQASCDTIAAEPNKLARELDEHKDAVRLLVIEIQEWANSHEDGPIPASQIINWTNANTLANPIARAAIDSARRATP